MNQTGRTTILLASLALLNAACGDSIVFLGVTPARMMLVAGVPGERGSSLGDSALDSRFQGPQGLAIDEDGSAYIADATVARILRLRLDGRLDPLYDLRDCASSCILSPAGLALDGNGDLLIADPAGHRVWRMDPGTGAYAPFAGDGSATSGPDGAARLAGGLIAPADVAVADDGTVYVSDRGARRIRSITPAGLLASVAGTGEAGDDGDGGDAADARFLHPAGLALAGSVLFVSDSAAHRVRGVSLLEGTIEAVAGTGAAGYFGDGRDALEARLSTPVGLAASADGATLYIADSGNHRVRVLDRSSGILRTFAGDGGTRFNGEDQTAGRTSLAAPWALALRAGTLFITDRALFIVWRTAVLEESELIS